VKARWSKFLQLQSNDMNKMFVSCLIRVYEKSPELFPTGRDDGGGNRGQVKRLQVISKRFKFSSYRAEDRSAGFGGGESMEEKEKAGANRPAFSMHEHYADVDLLRPAFMRYTKAA
jgi:hypothetical protein